MDPIVRCGGCKADERQGCQFELLYDEALCQVESLQRQVRHLRTETKRKDDENRSLAQQINVQQASPDTSTQIENVKRRSYASIGTQAGNVNSNTLMTSQDGSGTSIGHDRGRSASPVELMPTVSEMSERHRHEMERAQAEFNKERQWWKKQVQQRDIQIRTLNGRITELQMKVVRTEKNQPAAQSSTSAKPEAAVHATKSDSVLSADVSKQRLSERRKSICETLFGSDDEDHVKSNSDAAPKIELTPSQSSSALYNTGESDHQDKAMIVYDNNMTLCKGKEKNASRTHTSPSVPKKSSQDNKTARRHSQTKSDNMTCISEEKGTAKLPIADTDLSRKNSNNCKEPSSITPKQQNVSCEGACDEITTPRQQSENKHNKGQSDILCVKSSSGKLHRDRKSSECQEKEKLLSTKSNRLQSDSKCEKIEKSHHQHKAGNCQLEAKESHQKSSQRHKHTTKDTDIKVGQSKVDVTDREHKIADSKHSDRTVKSKTHDNKERKYLEDEKAVCSLKNRKSSHSEKPVGEVSVHTAQYEGKCPGGDIESTPGVEPTQQCQDISASHNPLSYHGIKESKLITDQGKSALEESEDSRNSVNSLLHDSKADKKTNKPMSIVLPSSNVKSTITNEQDHLIKDNNLNNTTEKNRPLSSRKRKHSLCEESSKSFEVNKDKRHKICRVSLEHTREEATETKSSKSLRTSESSSIMTKQNSDKSSQLSDFERVQAYVNLARKNNKEYNESKQRGKWQGDLQREFAKDSMYLEGDTANKGTVSGIVGGNFDWLRECVPKAEVSRATSDVKLYSASLQPNRTSGVSFESEQHLPKTNIKCKDQDDNKYNRSKSHGNIGPQQMNMPQVTHEEYDPCNPSFSVGSKSTSALESYSTRKSSINTTDFTSVASSLSMNALPKCDNELLGAPQSMPSHYSSQQYPPALASGASHIISPTTQINLSDISERVLGNVKRALDSVSISEMKKECESLKCSISENKKDDDEIKTSVVPVPSPLKKRPMENLAPTTAHLVLKDDISKQSAESDVRYVDVAVKKGQVKRKRKCKDSSKIKGILKKTKVDKESINKNVDLNEKISEETVQSRFAETNNMGSTKIKDVVNDSSMHDIDKINKESIIVNASTSEKTHDEDPKSIDMTEKLSAQIGDSTLATVKISGLPSNIPEKMDTSLPISETPRVAALVVQEVNKIPFGEIPDTPQTDVNTKDEEDSVKVKENKSEKLLSQNGVNEEEQPVVKMPVTGHNLIENVTSSNIEQLHFEDKQNTKVDESIPDENDMNKLSELFESTSSTTPNDAEPVKLQKDMVCDHQHSVNSDQSSKDNDSLFDAALDIDLSERDPKDAKLNDDEYLEYPSASTGSGVISSMPSTSPKTSEDVDMKEKGHITVDTDKIDKQIQRSDGLQIENVSSKSDNDHTKLSDIATNQSEPCEPSNDDVNSLVTIENNPTEIRTGNSQPGEQGNDAVILLTDDESTSNSGSSSDLSCSQTSSTCSSSNDSDLSTSGEETSDDSSSDDDSMVEISDSESDSDSSSSSEDCNTSESTNNDEESETPADSLDKDDENDKSTDCSNNDSNNVKDAEDGEYNCDKKLSYNNIQTQDTCTDVELCTNNRNECDVLCDDLCAKTEAEAKCSYDAQCEEKEDSPKMKGCQSDTQSTLYANESHPPCVSKPSVEENEKEDEEKCIDVLELHPTLDFDLDLSNESDTGLDKENKVECIERHPHASNIHNHSGCEDGEIISDGVEHSDSDAAKEKELNRKKHRSRRDSSHSAYKENRTKSKEYSYVKNTRNSRGSNWKESRSIKVDDDKKRIVKKREENSQISKNGKFGAKHLSLDVRRSPRKHDTKNTRAQSSKTECSKQSVLHERKSSSNNKSSRRKAKNR